jgi:hypothetical protein
MEMARPDIAESPDEYVPSARARIAPVLVSTLLESRDAGGLLDLCRHTDGDIEDGLGG